mgnify:CR=1 FL=1
MGRKRTNQNPDSRPEATLLLGGCANTQPIKNIEQEAITHTLTQTQVEKAIMLAGLKKHWVMKVVSPGLIRGDLAPASGSARTG